MIDHRFVVSNSLRMHIAEAGHGPLIILAHGFPECWYSWRHQIEALASAGYHVVAPDMRGYGRTESPPLIESYTMLHLVGDMVGLLDALGAGTAVIAGHDWGSVVAWKAAQLRPDRFTAVIALADPYRPHSSGRPTAAMPETEDALFYMLYFQEPGVAEAEYEADIPGNLLKNFHRTSGDVVGRKQVIGAGGVNMVRKGGGFLTDTPLPNAPPNWLGQDGLQVFVEAFRESGFRGPLNWYRNLDRNWELLAPWADAKVLVPAIYIVGDRDIVLGFPGTDQLLEHMPRHVPALRGTVFIEGAGHRTQQERPAQTTEAMLDFLRTLDG